MSTGPGTVHVVLPGSVADPATPSGGNTYDRQMCQGLRARGWAVWEHPVGGAWPTPGAAERGTLAQVLAAIPDDGVVLLDGLVACGVPEILAPHAERLRPVILVHLPLADETGLTPQRAAELNAHERNAVHTAAAVIATSAWTSRRLVTAHELPAERVHIAVPGVAPADPAPGTDGGSQLLCVAAVTPRKGHDVLVEALAGLADRPWTCRCVGAVTAHPDHVERVRRAARSHRLDDRFQLVGPRSGAELAAAYADADLLVLPSRAEPYGMVVTEALARGIPVLASAVDGLPEALGRAPDGTLPGILVPAGDAAALGTALRRWLSEPQLRRRLRHAAGQRRAGLRGWDSTTAAVAAVLERVRRQPRRAG